MEEKQLTIFKEADYIVVSCERDGLGGEKILCETHDPEVASNCVSEFFK